MCIVHSKLHNIYCQLRSIELIQSFKISSNTRREPSLPAGPTFSPPTNKELWRPWWRVRELISVFVFISYLSPFLEEFCASGVFVEIFSWYNLALHIEEERNSNHILLRLGESNHFHTRYQSSRRCQRADKSHESQCHWQIPIHSFRPAECRLWAFARG